MINIATIRVYTRITESTKNLNYIGYCPVLIHVPSPLLQKASVVQSSFSDPSRMRSTTCSCRSSRMSLQDVCLVSL